MTLLLLSFNSAIKKWEDIAIPIKNANIRPQISRMNAKASASWWWAMGFNKSAGHSDKYIRAELAGRPRTG